jgi:folylpolyglutamate synthase
MFRKVSFYALPFTSTILTRHRPGTRVLVFNQQGHRDSLTLLEDLYSAITSHGLVKFDHVIFCTSTGEQKGSMPSPALHFARRLINATPLEFTNASIDKIEVADLRLQKAFAERWRSLDPSPSTTIKVLPLIEDALDYVRELGMVTGQGAKGERETQVLITGSLHLVGRALGALEKLDAL